MLVKCYSVLQRLPENPTHLFCCLSRIPYAPFTLDEGADTVWLPLKYFEKS